MEIKLLLATTTTSQIFKIKYDNQFCILKTLPKNLNSSINILKEIKIHKSLNNKNIIKFISEHHTIEAYKLLFEYGEYLLRNLIKDNIGIKPAIAHMFFVQLISAVKYLQSRGICHRDIKPENIVISKDGNLKLIDFGYATLFYYKKNRILKNIAGSYPFMAPEVLKQSYNGSAADIWSCGITLINMLTGILPWKIAAESDMDYIKYINNNKHDYQPFNILRKKIYILINHMLNSENIRYTITDIENNEWIMQENSFMDKNRDCLDASFLLEAKEDIISDLNYTQPNELRKIGECFINISQPAQSDNLPIFYNIYVNSKPKETIAVFKNILEQMIVPCNIIENSIVFSTTDTKKNKLNGEIIAQLIADKCRITIKRTNGDLKEFQKFVAHIRNNFTK